MALTAEARKNLAIGDKIWARYKGEVYVSEVVEANDFPAGIGFVSHRVQQNTKGGLPARWPPYVDAVMPRMPFSSPISIELTLTG